MYRRVASSTWGPSPTCSRPLDAARLQKQKLVIFGDVKLYFSRSANWTFMQLCNLNYTGLPNHTCKGKCPTHHSNSQKLAFLAPIRSWCSLTIIPRVRVGYERVGYNHHISNKRKWNNCFFKKLTKYREFFPTLFVKATNFELVFNFEQTHTHRKSSIKPPGGLIFFKHFRCTES